VLSYRCIIQVFWVKVWLVPAFLKLSLILRFVQMGYYRRFCLENIITEQCGLTVGALEQLLFQVFESKILKPEDPIDRERKSAIDYLLESLTNENLTQVIPNAS